MKIAVQIGAGKIGRGFLAQVFHDSDYHIIFIDFDTDLIQAINRLGKYQIKLVNDYGEQIKTVDQISAISAFHIVEVVSTIAKADIIAVSVGVPLLEKVAQFLIEGFRRRWRECNFSVLPLIIAEEQINAFQKLRQLMLKILNPTEQRLFGQSIACVETSIERIFPDDWDLAGENSLQIKAEPYNKLPLDREGFLGEIPDLKYIEPYSPFIHIRERKGLLFQAAGIVFAYLGNILGKKLIWEAVVDPEIYFIGSYTLEQIRKCFVAEYNSNAELIDDYHKKILRRLANKALTINNQTFGGDPYRILGPEGPIKQAFKIVRKNNLDTSTILLIIAAGLCFHTTDNPDDRVQRLIQTKGLHEAVQIICGLEWHEANQISPKVNEYYHLLMNQPQEVYHWVCQEIRTKGVTPDFD